MAIADPGRQKDGFNGLPLGMDSSKAPNLIDKQSYALGVNVVARGGKVKTRPGFEQLDLQSDSADPDALSIFQSGYFQGACVYNQPVNRDEPSDVSQGGKDKSYIIAVVDGWIFRIDPQTKKIIRLNGNPGTMLGPATVTSLISSSNVATVTTSTPHNLSPGDKINYNGASPSAFNVSNATVTACPSVYQFQFSAPGSGTTTATVVGAYTIATGSQGYLRLPEFMDTTYYTLGIAGATKLSDGSGFTASGRVLIEDEFPTGVTLGRTGSGFAASTQQVAGQVLSITVTSGGSGYQVTPPTVTITGGGGSGATAIATLDTGRLGGTVNSVIVTNPGSGYTSAPTVTFSAGFGNLATAVANIPTSGALNYVNVSSAGSGFSKFAQLRATEAVTVNLAPRFTRDSTASTRPWPDQNHKTRRHYFAQTDKFLIIQDGINRPFIFDGSYIRRSYIEGNPALSRGTNSTGAIQSILISSRGSGYTAAPTVTISAPPQGGTQATATASISASGQLNSITITNSGSGYLSQPTITITSSNGPGSGARAYSILNPPKEVPIGSLMAYGQGRLFVANSNRFEIFALDLVGSHVNAATGTTSTGTVYYPMSDPRMSVILNTENTYLSEGGSLLAPSFMGKIVSLRVLPVQNTTAGQGQLFAFCEFGAASFKVSAARNSWGSTQDFQVILFKDIGSVGPDAFAQVNGDLFFRATDGLRSYRNASAEFAAYGNTGMSAEMDRFMKNEPVHLMYGTTCGYSSEGRLLITAIPQEKQLENENSLPKLYFKAVVCLDFNSQNGSLGKTSAAYDGIWTGLDFVHILSGEFGRRPRTYFLAYSCDLLSLWEVNSKFAEDRPVGGVDLSLSPSEMTGTRTTNTFGASSKTETQISLARYENFKPDSLRLEISTSNAATGWTSAGMGTQGVTVSYAFSDLDVPAAGALTNPAISPFVRTASLLFPSTASASSLLPIDLGPEKASGFLYVRLTALGSLPAGNTVSYNVALEGESSAAVPIRCELETASFTFNDGFEEKRLIRTDLWLSDLRDQTDVEVYYRPDQYPSWLFWDQFSLLPETSIAIRPLPSDSVVKGAISSALPQEEYSVDLGKYATRLTRGLGFRLDFGIGSAAPGTGADPYSVRVTYQISNLTPAQKNALVVGSAAYTDFQNAYRTVSVPIPTSTSSRYVNLFRPAGRYLYFKLVYPTIFTGTSYDFTLNLFGLEQGGETPDQVLSGGFLGSLLNLYPQFAPQIRLMNPVEQPDPITGRLFSHGYEFQQRLVWTGNATLQKGYLHAMSLVEPVGGNAL